MGVYILQRGCLLCLFFAEAVVGPNIEQTEVKHPRFLYVVIKNVLNPFAWDVCGQQDKQESSEQRSVV